MRTLLAVLALAVASASASTFGWIVGERSPADHMTSFSVALKQNNLDELERRFWDISTPGRENYGNFMSHTEINDLVATDADVVTEVLVFLQSHEGVMCKALSDSLRCVGPIGSLEAMLSTEFHMHTHEETGKVEHKIARATGYQFPVELMEHVEFMTGLQSLPIMRYGRVNPPVMGSNGVDYFVVPSTLTYFYSLENAKGGSMSVQAASEFQGLPGYEPSDVTKFIADTTAQQFEIAKHIGPFNPSTEPESELDAQYIGATGRGNTNWYYTTGDWMYEFAQSIMETPTGIDYYSMSYGWYEGDQCAISPSSQPCESGGSTTFVERTNTEFMKIGASGVTLLAATGDSGAHGRTDGGCMNARVRPAFPAASPYITAVGATQVLDGETGKVQGASFCDSNQCATGGREVTCSTANGALITSGGGFSDVAAMPSYQKDVVSKYLQNSSALPPPSDFNNTGRGFPDVAALGHKVAVWIGGQAEAVDGTSCACPEFAGILAALGADLNKKLGFANPLIYQAYAEDNSAFNDITEGNNKCTEQTCDCKTGFYAAPGWDATTGLGTPNYPKLLAAMRKVMEQ